MKPGPRTVLTLAVCAPGLLIVAALWNIRIVRNSPDAGLERLRALPYLEYSDEPAELSLRDVVGHEKDAASDGYNLYQSRLMDMEGKTVQEWSRGGASGLSPALNIGALLDDGSVLAWEVVSLRLLKLDWHSNLVWKSDLRVHHEIALTSSSTILVPTKEVHRYHGRQVEFDVLLELSMEGGILWRWSTYETIDELKGLYKRSSLDLDTAEVARRKRKGPRPLRKKSPFGGGYDYYHLNSIQELPETPLGTKNSRFPAGNLLISFRSVHLILILERETGEVVWSWGPGEVERQHMPHLMANGNLLVFDNGNMKRGYSRVIELDPVKKQIVWEYRADPPESFFTLAQGSAQRLGNGNTLIMNSAKGRAFEVTTEGRIVWEWFNPVTSDGKRERVYRMIRLEKGKIDRILGSTGDGLGREG